MRNLFTRLASYVRQSAAAFIVGLGIGGLLVGPAAMALVIPQQFAPRYFQTQQTHYLRFAINFNSCVPLALTCSFKVGSVPYNAFMVRAFTQTYTTFSGGGVTAYTVSFGTTAATTTELMALTTILTAGNAITQAIAATGLIAATGNGITPTGANGGFDIWAVYAQTGAAPSAGVAVIVIEWITPNDGSCVYVPLGATSPAC